ncbi:hypothetical protein T07_9271 [Trichinella nelsoni]|uniref:Uncharacterized protein n=1 Tax=Trichinella nelsoni TaxID=6336 RepID=A0A0V0RXW5_9BILA|nr:hypothetical protein T07_9271 [Trichinella nelsoni]
MKVPFTSENSNLPALPEQVFHRNECSSCRFLLRLERTDANSAYPGGVSGRMCIAIPYLF